eukprot:4415930-Pleurochrysis_carterae.AAC.1
MHQFLRASAAAAAKASATVAGNASAGLHSCVASLLMRLLGQPQEAEACTAANVEVAGAGGSSVTAAFTKPAAGAATPLADGGGQPPAQINVCAGGDAVAADDDKVDYEVAAAAPATPAPPPGAERHAATYELECIRLRQK